MTNADRDHGCMNNRDRAREIVYGNPWRNPELPRDAVEETLVRAIAAALDELSQRHEVALRAAEERGAEAMRSAILELSDELPDWTLGAAENMRALEKRALELDPATVVASRRPS